MSLSSISVQLYSLDFSDRQNFHKNVKYLSRVIQQLSASDDSKSLLVPIVEHVRYAIRTLTRLHNSLFGKRHSETKNKLSTLMSHVSTLIHEKKLASEKFRSLVKKVQIFSRGVTVSGTRIIDGNYWTEKQELSLHIGDEIYQGHFTPDTFVYRENKLPDPFLYAMTSDDCLPKDEIDEEKSYLTDWKKGKDQHGTPFLELYSFEGYMNTVVIPSLSPEEKERLRSVCAQRVEYYTPQELKTLEAHVEENGLIYTHTPFLNQWLSGQKNDAVSYRDFLKKEKRLSYPVTSQRYYLSDSALSYIFVLRPDGSLYVHCKQKGTTQHSSLANGQAVLAAGLLQLDRQGRISRLEPHSGHYKPGVTQMMTMLEYLNNHRVHINRLKIEKLLDIHEVRTSVGQLHSGRNSGKITMRIPRRSIRKWKREEKKALKNQIIEKDPSIQLTSLAKKPYRELRALLPT